MGTRELRGGRGQFEEGGERIIEGSLAWKSIACDLSGGFKNIMCCREEAAGMICIFHVYAASGFCILLVYRRSV